MVARLLGIILAAALAAPALAEERSGTLAKIEETGAIVIGHRTSSPPFSFVDGSGLPIGYSIDLCLRIVDEVRAELNRADIEVEFVQVDPDTRIDMVASGEVDIECGSSTATLSRMEKVDFTSLVFITGTTLLTKQGSGIVGLTDIEGKRIAVAENTTTVTVISESLQRLALTADIIIVGDHDEGLAAVEEGRVDGYASDRIVLIGLAQRSSLRNELTVVNEFLSHEPYGFIVRRNDADFRLVANRALSRIYQSGEIAQIYTKWFEPMGLQASAILRTLYVLQVFPN